MARNPVSNYETEILDSGESEQTVDLSAKYQGFDAAKDAESSQDELTTYPSLGQQVESVVDCIKSFDTDHVIGHVNGGSSLKNHLNDTPRSCKFQKNENGSPGFNGKGPVARNFMSYKQQNGEEGNEASNDEEEAEEENDQDSSELGDKKITFAQDECNSIAAPLEQQS